MFLSAVYWEMVRKNDRLEFYLAKRNVNMDRMVNTLIHFAEFRTLQRRQMYFNFGGGLITVIKAILKALQNL